MTQLLFIVIVVAILLNCATVALSIARPELRVWPPPRRASWQYYYNGVMSYVGMFGLLALGAADWNSAPFGHGSRFVVGGLLMSCGLFAGWGFLTLGLHASQGLGNELVTRGAYRYSRNPQYVGTMPTVLGYAIICNSSLALVVAILLCGLFALIPFAEESWCREKLGSAYDAYAAGVPRFLSVRGLRGGQ